MKYSSLGGNGNSSSGRWRFKSTTVKAFVICLFAFSAVFITYQLIYYVSLTEYQFQETQNLHQERLTEAKSTTPNSKNLELQFDKFEDNLVVPQIGDGGGLPKQEVHFERKKGKPVLSNKIVGVKPSDLHLYTDQQLNRSFFKCLTTSKKIKWDKVNDDYCDCTLDGSDEPSTGACLNGKFYCLLNKDGSTGYITSSRVNDGICDCADGTDEHLGIVKCKKD